MIQKKRLSITIVFDNYPHAEGIQTLWGFSCFIETPNKNILFDAGSNGRVLLENMPRLGKEVRKLDMLFLTHHHWDHIGGFDSVIELAPEIDIIAPSSLSRLLVKDLTSMVRSVRVIDEESVAICEDVYTTGMMGEEIAEQALIIDTDEGLIVMTGCAHSGIVEIARRAQELHQKRITLLVGGFHLMRKSEEEIAEVVEALQRMDIDTIAPTHCTGDLAKARLREAFGDAFMGVGAGWKSPQEKRQNGKISTSK